MRALVTGVRARSTSRLELVLDIDGTQMNAGVTFSDTRAGRLLELDQEVWEVLRRQFGASERLMEIAKDVYHDRPVEFPVDLLTEWPPE